MGVLLVFHACGIAYNTYLVFLLRGCSSPSSVNHLIGAQIGFNIFNIISHAVVEVSNGHHVVSAGSTALSVYSLTILVALRCNTTLGYRRRLSTVTITCIVVFIIIVSLGLTTVFERRYELCDFGNCFSTNLAKTDDKVAVLKFIFGQFLIPSIIQLAFSMVMLVRIYQYNKSRMDVVGSKDKSRRFRFLWSSSAALSFYLVLGEIFVQFFRRYNSHSKNETDNACALSCLYDELFCVMSMFPVFIRCLIIEENKQQ